MLCEWRIRKKGSTADPYVDYGGFPSVFCLKINHGGSFTPPPKIRYKGGKVNWVDAIDSDVFSIVEVDTMLKELGYEKPSFDYYFKEPKKDLDNGLKKLSSDQDVLQMLRFVDKHKVIDLYVDHSVTKEALIVDESLLVNELDNDNCIGSQDLDTNDADVLDDVSEDEWLQNSLKKLPIRKKKAVENVDDDRDVLSGKYAGSDNDQGSNRKKKGVEKGEASRSKGMDVDDDSVEYAGFDNVQGSSRKKKGVEKGEEKNSKGMDVDDEGSNSDNDSDSQDSDFFVDEENMIDDVDVDMGEFLSNIDPDVEWVGSSKQIVEVEEEFVDETVIMDEISSGSDCEYEGRRKKALKMYHKMQKANAINSESSGTSWKENFFIGMSFTTNKELKQMVSRVAVEQRRELHLKKNDQKRVRVICRGKVPQFISGSNMPNIGGSGELNQSKDDGQSSGSKSKPLKKTKAGGDIKDKVETCPWYLQCSKLPNEETWAVKTFNDVHKCLQSRVVKKCTASFLSKSVEDSLKPYPKIPLNSLQGELQKKYEVGISVQKVFRAKKMAQERVEGNHVKQYSQLRDYCLELKRSNPNTTIHIEVEKPEDVSSIERKFKRIYVCLGPLKDGFKAGKRELLGFDGCFLSGTYPGWILTAVGVDPNNGIYPLAYAVVESENKDSWSWFLQCVGDDLELVRNSNFTFISDRQKGIIPAIAELFPCAEHRFCLKHIYDNMRLSYKGQLYNEMLWRCATSTTVQRFDKHMEKLKDFNINAYEWLRKIPPQHWSRSHFSGRAHCDVLLSNMCEVLNRQLVDGRDKPIITCLEFIRQYLMKRIVNVQKVIVKSDGPLTPNATRMLKSIEKEASQMKIDWNGGDLYQCQTPYGDQCVVNMATKECSCRKWELTGIPCKHAVAAIWDMAGNGEETATPEAYCHEVHWLSTWKDMYRFKINPCNGPDFWEKCSVPTTIVPPKITPKIGRPPKKRKKSAAELAEGIVKGNKLSRAGKSITCGLCKGVGHNRKTCTNNGPANETQQSSQAPQPTQDTQAPQPTQDTQASQSGTNTTVHPSQLHASPTKMTKNAIRGRISSP